MAEIDAFVKQHRSTLSMRMYAVMVAVLLYCAAYLLITIGGF